MRDPAVNHSTKPQSTDKGSKPSSVVANPLSLAQEHFWFLQQMSPTSSVYNIPLLVSLTGPVDVPALIATWQDLGIRHEVLRSSVSVFNSRPVQLVAPRLTAAVPVWDVRDLPIEQRGAEAERLVRAEAARPFDLGIFPLFRISLVRLSDQEFWMMLVVHHVITDGWSLGILLREFTLLYHARTLEQPSPLPPLSSSYRDYGLWQRQRLQGELLRELQSYWQNQLAGLPPVLNVASVVSRPAIADSTGETQRFTISEKLTGALNLFSRNHGVTLFMTLLAGFKVLLSRCTGQEDIAVGTVVANRSQRDFEAIVGLFANTIVLRTRLAGAASFDEILGRVRETALAAYAHQELPFHQVVEAVHPERSLGHNPLFQVLFVLQNGLELPLALPNTELTKFRNIPASTDSTAQFPPPQVTTGTAKLDLTLVLTEANGGLSGAFEYRRDLFSEAAIRSMITDYQMLIERIVVDSRLLLKSLPLMDRPFAERPNPPNEAVEPPAVGSSLSGKRVERTAKYVGPRTPTESAVASIWSEVLGIDPIGVDESFFGLGGHSLLATSLMSRVREFFRMELPLRSLFEEPTIAGMAIVVTRAQIEEACPKDVDTLLSEIENLSAAEANARIRAIEVAVESDAEREI